MTTTAATSIDQAAREVADTYRQLLAEHTETPDVTPPPAFADIVFAAWQQMPEDQRGATDTRLYCAAGMMLWEEDGIVTPID